MNDNHYQSVNFYYTTTANKPSGKLKFLIVSLIFVAVIGLFLLIVFIISKNQNTGILPAGKENSATLQIYAALDDEISVENIESQPGRNKFETQVLKNLDLEAHPK